MIKCIFLLIMALTIFVADIEGHSTSMRRRRYNLLKKYHKTQKTVHFGQEPKKKFLQQKMVKMLIQRRNFANKLFF